VIGGLMFATVATLVFVPSVFALLHRSQAGGKEALIAKSESEPLHA
jgi:hypothetical protein